MNERFINPCVELGGESWLSSETEDLEELPESFGRLQSRGRRVGGVGDGGGGCVAGVEEVMVEAEAG